MSDSKALINIGELSKPATVLIEKIGDAIGGIFRPYQIRRVAQAEADAKRIETVSQIEITELQRRAAQRFFAEEAKKQANMESITEQAISDLKDDAKPQDLEEDWIAHFFDKCRLVSDEQMQQLWARVLAEETNNPGNCSKRTVSVLSSLDKSDAMLFQQLCGFGWVIGDFVPLVFKVEDPMYNERGINFASLTHLNNLGLVNYNSLTGFQRNMLPQKITVLYQDIRVDLELKNPEDNSVELGYVMLTLAGKQLAPLCRPQQVPGFMSHIVERWKLKGYKVMNLLPES